jgi:serine phosphatase RsbU (regulator of sigma subunit)/HAMP domain-containing protein/putative methionine-R-sulfoxide reductase with GAF domain
LGGREMAGDAFIFPTTDERRVAAFVPIPGLGWVAGSSAPAAEVLDPVTRSITQTSLVGVAVLLLAATLSALQAGRIARSLRRLAVGARRVGEGDFSQSIVISSGDEVEEVARSLDETRLNLKAYTEALAGIAEAGRALTESLDMERLKQTISRSLEQLFGARMSWILLFDEKKAKLEPLLLHGEGLESLWGESLEPGEGVAGRVFESGETAVVGDIEVEQEIFGRGSLLGRGARSVVQLPLKVADRPFGVLGLSSSTPGPEAFAGRDLELLEIFASQVSTALQNARFFADRERSAHLGRALNRANARLISTLDLRRVIPEVLEEVTEALGCDRSVLALRDEEGWRVEHAAGIPGRYPRQHMTLDELPVTALAAHARATVLSNDAQSDPRLSPADMRRLGLRSFLAVPLVAHTEVTGVISFAYVSAPVLFSEAEVDFARRLAASMSLALENSRLYSAEQDIADTLQEALLTMPPEIPGVDFGQLYRSATEMARVGGDFYDLFEVEHGRLAVIIGDVSGHGLEAAALTSLAKNTLKAYAYAGQSAADILSMTNAVLVASSPPASFVTVFVGLLERDTNTLCYASAGHPPALLTRREGGVLTLGRPSTVLGVFAGQTYREQRVTLRPGDMLVLYTDGVIEARRQGTLFGEARLQQLAATLVGLPAAEVPERILAEVLRFSEGILSDDVALLAVSLLHPTSRARAGLRAVPESPEQARPPRRLRVASPSEDEVSPSGRGGRCGMR